MSDTVDVLRDAIVESATDGVARVTVGNTSVDSHSLDARIRALKELQKTEAAASGTLPIRLHKVISQGL